MSADPAVLERVRAIADAVLYEGYLLYPYRASSSKNQSRWQFGVLGPPRAAAESFAESPRMEMQCLLEPSGAADAGRPDPNVVVRLRFLQLQTRTVQQLAEGQHVPVGELLVNGRSLLSWEEAVECEELLPSYELAGVFEGGSGPLVETVIDIPGGEEVEEIVDASGAAVGRIVRRREPLRATVAISATAEKGCVRLAIAVQNAHPDPASGKDDAIRLSMIGTHVLIQSHGAAGFVSLLEPPDHAADAAARCRQERCFPVLVGAPGTTDMVLGSPIILYDYPEIAAESAGALFDSTEIDEILTLRVMTMTEAEKAEARATDPRAAEIIDRCDDMPTQTLQQLHGVLRDPHASLPAAGGVVDVRNAAGPDFDTGEVPWWDPAADEAVRPELDSVVIAGVPVSKGSMVRVHPSRRADAQDMFFAGQVARVTAVLSDVDGGTHVALVLADDPAADMHDWYGRYLYFDPEELEPLDAAREETRS